MLGLSGGRDSLGHLLGLGLCHDAVERKGTALSSIPISARGKKITQSLLHTLKVDTCV